MSLEVAGFRRARVIRANYMLQAKVGSGPLDPAVVRRCQRVMDENDVDFAPLAREYLDTLGDALHDAKRGIQTRKESTRVMTAAVMQLKAHAALFHYDLVGNLANIMLSFLESGPVLDEDALEIIDAHHKTLTVIIFKTITGPGGKQGRLIEEELQGACRRYFAKKKAGTA